MLPRALIASVVAHAVLLSGSSWLLPVTPNVAPAAITASLVMNSSTSQNEAGLPAHAVEVAKGAGAARPRPMKAPVMSPKTPEALAAENVAPSSGGVSAKSDAGALATASATETGQSGHAGPAQKTGAPAAPAAAPRTPAREEAGVDSGDIREYRTSLAISAKRFNRYPPLAKERGWEGKVEIAVDHRHRLPGPEVSVVASSGRKVLDDQALEMIRQAVRMTDPPQRLQGRDFRMLLPVTFSLDDER